MDSTDDAEDGGGGDEGTRGAVGDYSDLVMVLTRWGREGGQVWSAR